MTDAAPDRSALIENEFLPFGFKDSRAVMLNMQYKYCTHTPPWKPFAFE